MLPYRALQFPKSTAAAAPAIPSTLDVSASIFKVGVGQATASFSLNADGSTGGIRNYDPGSWITPVGGSYGSSYWAKVDITDGAVTTGTTGSRVALTSGYTWTVSTTGSAYIRQAEAIGTIEIWNAAAAGTMVASGTFSLTAEIETA